MNLFYHPPKSWAENSPIGTIIHVPGSTGVVLDEPLADIWKGADGRGINELFTLPQFKNRTNLSFELKALRLAGLLRPPIEKEAVPVPEELTAFPMVSVIIVTRNGLDNLKECLPSLYAQTYSNLEIIVVDDQSLDGTREWLIQDYPAVHVIQQLEGPNFAAGCNLGIQNARGELIFLLNNDTFLDPYCIQELVAVQSRYTRVGGVAAMLRFYHNRPFINGLGTYIPALGFGHDLAIGSLDVGQLDDLEETPLLCFAAALLPKSALNEVGLLDEAYGFYYEDADWSYRARRSGLKLLAASRAKVYHKFGATMGQRPSSFKIKLVTRNRQRFVLKNLSRKEAVRQWLAHGGEDLLYLLKYLLKGQIGLSLSIIQAWYQLIRDIPQIIQIRLNQERGWKKCPVDLASIAEAYPPPEMQGTYPRLTVETVDRKYRPYLARLEGGHPRYRLLIISPDIVDTSMGGVGIRYWELAKVLADHAEVILSVPQETRLTSDKFVIKVYFQGDERTLKPLVAWADIVLLSGFIIYHHPFLTRVPQYLIVDLYDPTVLENLERFSTRSREEQEALHSNGLATYNDLMRLGDFFICASEKQRDYWLGGLTCNKRINPKTYQTDSTMRRLIDVVPFGLPDKVPHHFQPVLKGNHPGIGKDDKVVLWGGGIWDWLDPLTAIEAMPRVLAQISQARLFFMGIKHPNPEVPISKLVSQAQERARALGLLDQAIFFNDWVPYHLRENYLLESDLGISLHGDHIETRFAVRTRLMDYLWAGLPMVISGGDTLSDLVGSSGLGRVVKPGSSEEVAQALVDLLLSPVDRSQFDKIIQKYSWTEVAKPLVSYVSGPWRNGDHPGQHFASLQRITPFWQLPKKAFFLLLDQGPGRLLKKIKTHLVFRWRQP